MQTNSGDCQEQIIELETKVAYLEDTVEQLSDELAAMQKQNALNTDALKYLHRQLESMSNDKGGATMQNEPPPPHY